jgi:aryl-alcohol dehydrogenase-like predicted oxidoreductase
MNYRELGRTGWRVSEISFGAWAIGGSWGDVDDAESIAALHRAIDLGVNFIDTADVYGDGRSERLISQVLASRRGQRIYVATKAGRRLSPHVADGYNKANLTAFVERSLTNLGVEALDLVQLHCPPTDVFYRPEVFAALDDLVAAGKLRHYGVSVEKVEEGLKALEYPGVQSVQIIFNMFRQRPAEQFFPAAQAKQVGILARVPLASGLLTGKLNAAKPLCAGRSPVLQSIRRRRSTWARRSAAWSTRSGLQAVDALQIAGARGRDAVGVRAALDIDVRRGDVRDPRRKAAEPGRG